jgi:O-antigen ligase
MITMTAQPQHRYLSYAPASPQVVAVTRRKYTPTTRIDQLLLLLHIVLLPWEEALPGTGGYSFVFLLFAVSSIYIAFRRFGSITKVWNRPVFLASYVFILFSLILEGYSPFASYKEIIRIVQMYIGAIIIATLCRDTRALRVCIFGYILVGIYLALYLFFFSYGALQGATATDYNEASRVRGEVFQEDTPLKANLNSLAFFLAQGTATALAIALMSRSVFTRYSLFGITAFCFIASFLPLSRSGTAITLIACVAVVLAYMGANRKASFQRFMQIIVLMLGLGVCLLLWVPQAAFSRFTVSATAPDGTTDARTRMYKAAWVHLPEYGLVGVGAGNFWEGPWGKHSEYSEGRRKPLGAHNCFIQIMIYWGLLGLLSLMSVVYYAYKCLPKECGNEPLSLAVLGMVVTLFGVMFVIHGLAFKGFSLGLGILVGAQYWIWPTGETQSWRRMVRKTLGPVHK